MSVQQQYGYTLVELMIVVIVLAAIAAIAVPATSSNSDRQLDLAAQEFAAAIRFARSEAIRTGEPYGFHDHATQKQLQIFRLDTGSSPATLVYDVYHPIDKSLYDINFDLPPVAVSSIDHTTVYRGTCNQRNRIYFDRNGTPWCSRPETILLDQFEARITLGTSVRTVTLDRITGRVTIQ